MSGRRHAAGSEVVLHADKTPRNPDETADRTARWVTTFAQVRDYAAAGNPTLCKTVGISRGSAPHPGPPSGMEQGSGWTVPGVLLWMKALLSVQPRTCVSAWPASCLRSGRLLMAEMTTCRS